MLQKGLSAILVLSIFVILLLGVTVQPADSSITVNANIQSDSVTVANQVDALIVPLDSLTIDMNDIENTNDPVRVEFEVSTNKTSNIHTETHKYKSTKDKNVQINSLVIDTYDNLTSTDFPEAGKSVEVSVSIQANHPDVDTDVVTKQFTLSRDIDNTSCKSILDSDPQASNGTYTINPNGNSLEVYCDMSTDGGGWTRIVNWDASSDSNDIFWDNATWSTNSVTVNNTDSIRYSGGPSDGADPHSILYDQSIVVPNQGEVRLKLDYDGDSMEDSASFFYAVDSTGSTQNIVCGDDRDSGSPNSYENPINDPPYSCSNTDDRSMEFTSTYSVNSGEEIDNYRWAALHYDNGSGDRSYLYSQTLWVR